MDTRRRNGALHRQRVAFYADFVLCPLVIGGLVIQAWLHIPVHEAPYFGAALLVGVAAWTLAEYLLHRFVLHGVPPFRRVHAMHHAAPQALIGASAWLSPGLLLALFMVIYRFGDPTMACGATTGVTLGYFVYVSIHCAAHRFPNLRWEWLRRRRRAHAFHHGSLTACNFGVSTGFWDVLLGTASSGRSEVPSNRSSREP